MISRRLAVVLLGFALLFSMAAQAETAKVTFILTNDIYQMSEQLMPDGKRRGGFARLAAVVKAERAKGGHVVFAHGGDTLSPSLMSSIDRGAHIVALTNMFPPDIFVPGNHEFDFGKQTFLQRMAEAKFPVYAANLRDANDAPLPGIKDRAIVTFDGVKVGLTGAAYDNTPRTSNSEDLRFLPTVATARQQAETLRREGADFVVAVAHADRSQAIDLAATNSVDLILHGHNHDLFVNFDGRRAIAESGEDAIYVTVVDVSVEVKEQNGRRETIWWPEFRVIDTANVTPDPEVAAAVAQFEAELAKEMDVALATTTVELDSRGATVRTREAAIGNLIADAMRENTHADVAIMNGGGIRAGKIYPAGSAITRRDVLSELPFGNKVVTLDISGRDLRQTIENALSQLPNATGRFPHVSGMTIEMDPRRPAGNRVLSIRVGGQPLSPTKKYRVATNDFMARGSDGYDALGAAKPILPVEDSPLLANEVMTYLRKIGTIRTGASGRIVTK
jgi:2',3'-cyclic-nucleotide 2'-phosphodiesterase (5'-nucleotidase family)